MTHDKLKEEVKLSECTIAAYEHVESVKPDDSLRTMWYGWALREAFEAGAEWQNARDAEVAALLEGLKVAKEALEKVVKMEDCSCECRFEPPDNQCPRCLADSALKSISALLSTEAQQ